MSAMLEDRLAAVARILAVAIAIVSCTTKTHADQSFCRQIAADSQIENHFARSQQKTILRRKGAAYAGLQYVVGPSDGLGTCRGDVVRATRGASSSTHLTYQCDYNGCAFGSNPTMIEWGDKVYILEQAPALWQLENLFGWKEMPSERRSLLAFRNLAHELYEVMPDGRVVIRCGGYGWKWKFQPEEELIAGAKECSSYSLANSQSIFPKKSVSNRILLEDARPFTGYPAMGFGIDLSKVATGDFDGDGVEERMVPVEGNSGAGCGCGMGGLIFLDSQNRPIEPKTPFSMRLRDFMDHMGCSESLDIVGSPGQYALVKKNRDRAREIYSLSGKNAFLPICTFVNAAPLAWKDVLYSE